MVNQIDFIAIFRFEHFYTRYIISYIASTLQNFGSVLKMYQRALPLRVKLMTTSMSTKVSIEQINTFWSPFRKIILARRVVTIKIEL